MRSASRRPRIARRALQVSRRAPVSGSARERIAAALELCSAEERALLSMMLIEDMTAHEAGEAMDLSVREVSRTYTSLLAALRRTLRGMNFRSEPRAALIAGERMRRAS
jgi:DNA-directed RNA polymerase specialized sigma24 family protein